MWQKKDVEINAKEYQVLTHNVRVKNKDQIPVKNKNQISQKCLIN